MIDLSHKVHCIMDGNVFAFHMKCSKVRKKLENCMTDVMSSRVRKKLRRWNIPLTDYRRITILK